MLNTRYAGVSALSPQEIADCAVDPINDYIRCVRTEGSLDIAKIGDLQEEIKQAIRNRESVAEGIPQTTVFPGLKWTEGERFAGTFQSRSLLSLPSYPKVGLTFFDPDPLIIE